MREVFDGGGGSSRVVAAIARDAHRVERRLLNASVGAANLLAVLAQDVHLVRDHVVAQAREEVAGVGVLRDEPQRFLLATAADEDGRVRTLDGLWVIQRALKLIVFAIVRRLVVGPHLARNLQCLLQALEALFERWEGDAQALVLLLIPGGADAKVGAALREDIERGGGLDEEAGMAIGHAGDHGAEPDVVGDASGKRQRTPAFEHLVFGGADGTDLKEVVHDPQAIEAGALGAASDLGEGVTEDAGATRPCEVGNLQSNAHRKTSVISSNCWPDPPI